MPVIKRRVRRPCAARRSRRHLALTAESYLRARIVVEHVLAPELVAPLTLLAGSVRLKRPPPFGR